jgi:hypothetical protein
MYLDEFGTKFIRINETAVAYYENRMNLMAKKVD